eukprot:4359136-Pyramimonas_sp.AAC.1
MVSSGGGQMIGTRRTSGGGRACKIGLKGLTSAHRWCCGWSLIAAVVSWSRRWAGVVASWRATRRWSGSARSAQWPYQVGVRARGKGWRFVLALG